MTANGSRIRRFYRWWIRELSKALTPQRSAARPWRTLLLRSANGLEIRTKTSAGIRHLGTLGPEDASDRVAALRRQVMTQGAQNTKHVLLRLSPDDVVQRTIQIPKAASDLIDSVLENQMERIVPWPLDEARYGYRLVGPNPTAPDQLDIHVVATTSGILDAVLQQARSLGLAPSVVDYGPDDEAAPGVDLMSLEPDPIKRTEKRIHAALAVSLAASLAVASFGIYEVWNRRTENSELVARIASAEARVADIKRLNDENRALREQRERLAKRKIDDPAVILLIEALSRALPDTAYLEELEIHGRETRIVGKSADPTGLITLLENTPEFEDVRFSAPTTREQGETLGTFSIVGRAQGGSQVEAQP